ncbi:hypothetical protein L210DRAFT_3531360 [Boletus edulis BED1]|uniref:Uncharacterized protein n=1 Tax=Boletus edulis BED1 TaxID=1328754 RepID=A0AAD4C0K5_BOLED|nr:hypothetical protein L210DRAFT_3531360 [Boletus edulis BED1]
MPISSFVARTRLPTLASSHSRTMAFTFTIRLPSPRNHIPYSTPSARTPPEVLRPRPSRPHPTMIGNASNRSLSRL